ncbi:hypothetical protein [Chamaesiphon sp. OTE_75_metabat_556]|nr:hypothetical protein [Chamaesiphon sp. OTE_75_metabat_556]
MVLSYQLKQQEWIESVRVEFVGVPAGAANGYLTDSATFSPQTLTTECF